MTCAEWERRMSWVKELQAENRAMREEIRRRLEALVEHAHRA